MGGLYHKAVPSHNCAGLLVLRALVGGWASARRMSVERKWASALRKAFGRDQQRSAKPLSPSLEGDRLRQSAGR